MLLDILRPWVIPTGLLLVQHGVNREQEQLDARRAELAALHEQIEARRAELARLSIEHRPDCLTLFGLPCDTPDACETFAASWDEPRAERCRQFTAADPPPAADVDEDQGDEPEPERAAAGLPPFAVFAAGALLGLAAVVGARARRRQLLIEERREQLRARDPEPVTVSDEWLEQVIARDPEYVERSRAGYEAHRRRYEAMQADVDEGQGAAVDVDPHACPWGCGWVAHVDLADADRQVRASLHGNACGSRPASMAVSG